MNLRLLSLFVKDCRNTDDGKVRSKCASAASLVGIFTNVFLSAMKLIIGIIAGSIAIVADAVNNIADAASSVITLVGFKLASKPADREHPFGHQRIEYVTGLIVSIIVCVLGIEFFTSSIDAIRNPTETDYSLPAIIILVVSIAAKLWQGTFYNSVGKHIDSGALKAASKDSFNDVISTAAVLVGAIISRFSGVNLDGWLGLAVACFIIKSGIGLVIETADPLLGTPPDTDFVKSVASKITAYDGVLGIHDLVVHSYGPARTFASVHVEVDASADIIESHDLIDNIEFDFRRQGLELVIHLDPIDTRDSETCELRRQVEAIVIGASEKFKTALPMHDFRMVKGITHTNILFDIVVPFECKHTPEAITEYLEKEIKLLSSTYNAVITCDRNYN